MSLLPAPRIRFPFLTQGLKDNEYTLFPATPPGHKTQYWGKVLYKDEVEAVLLTKTVTEKGPPHYSLTVFRHKEKTYLVWATGTSYSKLITATGPTPRYRPINTAILEQKRQQATPTKTEQELIFCLTYPYFEIEFPNYNLNNYRNNQEINNLFLRITYLLNQFPETEQLDVARYNFKLFNETKDIRSAYMSFREIMDSILKIKLPPEALKENFPRNRANYLQGRGFPEKFVKLVDKYITHRNKFAHLNNTRFIAEIKREFQNVTKFDMTKDLLYFIKILALRK